MFCLSELNYVLTNNNQKTSFYKMEITRHHDYQPRLAKPPLSEGMDK